MASQEISLPEGLQEFVEEQVASGGYGSVTDYVCALIQEAQQRAAQAELEAKLLEGLASGPATPMTPEDWAGIRRRVRERLERRSAE